MLFRKTTTNQPEAVPSWRTVNTSAIDRHMICTALDDVAQARPQRLIRLAPAHGFRKDSADIRKRVRCGASRMNRLEMAQREIKSTDQVERARVALCQAHTWRHNWSFLGNGFSHINSRLVVYLNGCFVSRSTFHRILTQKIADIFQTSVEQFRYADRGRVT